MIDELCILHCKVWHCVEVIEGSGDDAAVAEAARKAHKLNRRRSELVNAINALHGSGVEEIKV